LKPGGGVCTVTDSDEIIRNRIPLSVYFPETIEIELDRYPPIVLLMEMMISAGFTTLYESAAEHSYAMEHDLMSGPIPVKSRYLLL
jgi:hypothetical protein